MEQTEKVKTYVKCTPQWLMTSYLTIILTLNTNKYQSLQERIAALNSQYDDQELHNHIMNFSDGKVLPTKDEAWSIDIESYGLVPEKSWYEDCVMDDE